MREYGNQQWAVTQMIKKITDRWTDDAAELKIDLGVSCIFILHS